MPQQSPSSKELILELTNQSDQLSFEKNPAFDFTKRLKKGTCRNPKSTLANQAGLKLTRQLTLKGSENTRFLNTDLTSCSRIAERKWGGSHLMLKPASSTLPHPRLMRFAIRPTLLPLRLALLRPLPKEPS